MELKEIIYIEHLAGEFEDGIQVCRRCGHVICDYSGGGWVSSDGVAPRGWPPGPIYVSGKNPEVTEVGRPLQNYGDGDPYKRIIKSCV